MNFIDLFSGAGGLSEGFIKAGFNPIAHVEIDSNACKTIETRLIYHKLKKQNKLKEYYKYLEYSYQIIQYFIKYKVSLNTRFSYLK